MIEHFSKLDLGRLSANELTELENMKIVYEKFYNMEDDQFSNYELWRKNFADEWGNFDDFIRRFNYLNSSKYPKILAENNFEKLKETALQNTKELKTLKFFWDKFFIKNQYSNSKTTGFKNAEESFSNFREKTSIQYKKNIYKIKELFEIFEIENFKEWQKLILDHEIKKALALSHIIYGVKKKVKSHLPKKFPLY